MTILGAFWDIVGTFFVIFENNEQFGKFWEHFWGKFDQIFGKFEFLFFFSN